MMKKNEWGRLSIKKEDHEKSSECKNGELIL